MTNGKRDYKKEYAKYDSRPERIKARVEQNKARRLMEKAGKVHKGDGKDVDHIRAISKGGRTTPGNLRVLSARQNRSYRRKKDGSILNHIVKGGK